MERTGESPSGVTSMRKWTRPSTSRQIASRSRAGNSSVENRNGTAWPLVAVIYPSGFFVGAYPFGDGLLDVPGTCSALSGITTARGLYVEIFALRQNYRRPTPRALSVLGWS